MFFFAVFTDFSKKMILKIQLKKIPRAKPGTSASVLYNNDLIGIKDKNINKKLLFLTIYILYYYMKVKIFKK